MLKKHIQLHQAPIQQQHQHCRVMMQMMPVTNHWTSNVEVMRVSAVMISAVHRWAVSRMMMQTCPLMHRNLLLLTSINIHTPHRPTIHLICQCWLISSSMCVWKYVGPCDIIYYVWHQRDSIKPMCIWNTDSWSWANRRYKHWSDNYMHWHNWQTNVEPHLIRSRHNTSNYDGLTPSTARLLCNPSAELCGNM